MKVTSEVVLPVSIERAWDALVRWEDQPRWMKDADWVRVLGDQREGVGTTIAVKTRVLGVPAFTERLEVTIWEPPRRLVMAHRSFVRGVGTWRFQPVEGGTWFRWTEAPVRARPRRPVGGPVGRPARDGDRCAPRSGARLPEGAPRDHRRQRDRLPAARARRPRGPARRGALDGVVPPGPRPQGLVPALGAQPAPAGRV